LATPARLATSSSRVAANPRAMNSSSPAAMIAARRSAARVARFEGGLEDAAVEDDDAARAALRALAGDPSPYSCKAIFGFFIKFNMTD
jgi:hypothetical protein